MLKQQLVDICVIAIEYGVGCSPVGGLSGRHPDSSDSCSKPAFTEKFLTLANRTA